MLALSGCILPGYVMRDLVSGSQPDPHAQTSVSQTASGSSLAVGYDRSDPERPRAWIRLDGPQGGGFSRTFPPFGRGRHGAFQHAAVDPADGSICVVAGAEGGSEIAVVAFSSRGDVRWAIEARDLPGPTFGLPAAVVGGGRVFVLVGLREKERRSLLVAAIGPGGRAEGATIVRGVLEGSYFLAADRFDEAVWREGVGLTLFVGSPGLGAPWLARFGDAAELRWLREVRGPACLESPLTPVLDVTAGGDTVVAAAVRCVASDDVPDLAVMRLSATRGNDVTVLERAPPPGWPPPKRFGPEVPRFDPLAHGLAAKDGGGALVAATIPATPDGNTRLALFDIDPQGTVVSQRAAVSSTNAIRAVRLQGDDVVISTSDLGPCVFAARETGCGGPAAAPRVRTWREALRVTELQPSLERLDLTWANVQEELAEIGVERERAR
jgi:hypothetical protein